MLVSHKFDDKKIGKKVQEKVGFLMTNKKGGFLNLGIDSRYRGLFFRLGDEAIKIIDDIKVKGNITELRNTFWSTVRCRQHIYESFFMPFGTDALVYELDKEGEAELFFDVKKAYDNRVWGRNYNLSKEGNKLVIEFTKTTDYREDQSNGEKEYSIFIVIDSGNIETLNEWENQFYGADKERNSPPYERYVFKGAKIKSRQTIISCSQNKEEALRICDKVAKHIAKFKSLQKEYSRVSIKGIKNNKLNLAAKCAIEALDNLTVNYEDNVDIYAGLPWFFQFWSRDTLISLKALMLDKEYGTVKRILMEKMHHIQDDGLLPNRMPLSVIKSADSIGWYFRRWSDFIDMLREENQLKNYFKKSEIMFIINKLEGSINNIFRNYTIDSLARNDSQETWMDTVFEGDGRKGARIEIQALRIAMYAFLYTLTDNHIYKEIIDKSIKKVRELFWNGTYLKDGVGDATIRPNVFIAAYICPELLSREEWIKCFDLVLPKLWLEWGGLATIDKGDSHFHDNHTGENNASYHRGDSWYWVNNLAALVLYRFDKERYQSYISKIIDASCEDILFKGFIGCHSELSSAAMQKAEGCLDQAWSNAFFVEMIEEIYSTN